MQVEIKTPDIRAVETALGKHSKSAPKVITRVINRTLANIKKNLSIHARSRYIVKTKDIKATLKEQKANKSALNGFIKSSGIRLKLIKFKVRPSKPKPKNPPSAYKASVLKSKSPSPVKGGFVAQMKSGHMGLFKRNDEKQLPINEKVGPSIPQMIGNKNVWKKIEKEANKTLEKRLSAEIQHILRSRG